MKELHRDIWPIAPAWSIGPIEQEAEAELVDWSAFSMHLEKSPIETMHVVAHHTSKNKPHVTPAVTRFDPVRRRLLTNCGHVYQLMGPPFANSRVNRLARQWFAELGVATAKDATEKLACQIPFQLDAEHLVTWSSQSGSPEFEMCTVSMYSMGKSREATLCVSDGIGRPLRRSVFALSLADRGQHEWLELIGDFLLGELSTDAQTRVVFPATDFVSFSVYEGTEATESTLLAHLVASRDGDALHIELSGRSEEERVSTLAIGYPSALLMAGHAILALAE